MEKRNKVVITEMYCPSKKEWLEEPMDATCFDKVLLFGNFPELGNLYTAERRRSDGTYFTVLVKLDVDVASEENIRVSEMQ